MKRKGFMWKLAMGKRGVVGVVGMMEAVKVFGVDRWVGGEPFFSSYGVIISPLSHLQPYP
jgi:hypothetical protein